MEAGFSSPDRDSGTVSKSMNVAVISRMACTVAVAALALPTGVAAQRTVYVTNGGGNVATFAIAPGGELVAHELISGVGNTVRGIAIAPDGRTAYIVDSGRATVTSFAIADDGRLTQIGDVVPTDPTRPFRSLRRAGPGRPGQPLARLALRSLPTAGRCTSPIPTRTPSRFWTFATTGAWDCTPLSLRVASARVDWPCRPTANASTCSIATRTPSQCLRFTKMGSSHCSASRFGSLGAHQHRGIRQPLNVPRSGPRLHPTGGGCTW